MKIAIMQPYFVPYIGYWQLMTAVDKFVIFDDVNYITRGWINRNRVLINGEAKYFNLSLIGASQNRLINEIGVNNDLKLTKKNLLTVEHAYKKAPQYERVHPIIKEVLSCNEKNLVDYLKNSFEVISDYLGIQTQFLLSSSIEKRNELKGQEKILEICKALKASEYYNAIGGRELYSSSAFEKENIKLLFVEPEEIVYKQFGDAFQGKLSIIDVLMFNDKEEVKKMLSRYKLIEGAHLNGGG